MKGYIFYNGVFPSGSWPQRVRLTSKGLKHYGIENDIIISFFPPTVEDEKESPNNVNFMFKPIKNRNYEKNKFLYFFYYFYGIIKGYLFLRKNNKIDFVIFAQGSFLECFLITRYCKRKKIKFIIDLVDENAKKYEKITSIIDKIAIFNRDLYEKYIVNNSDILFVISSYLFDKYKSLYPNLIIYNSTPSLIDITDFELKKNLDIKFLFPDIYDSLISKKNKFLYAGSCARPNGIFFFLENIAELRKKTEFEFFIIFFIKEGNPNFLREKVLSLGLDDKIIINKAVSQKYIPAIYYKLSDYLFLPQQGDLCANAGFPSKTAELLSAGKPIIATNFSDLSKFLIDGYNALISEIGDYVKYQENLSKLLFDKALCDRISLNAKETARNSLDYRIGVQKIVNVLK